MPHINPPQRTLESILNNLIDRMERLEAGAVLAQGNGRIRVAAGEAIQSTDFDGALPSTPGTVGWALGGAGASAIFNNLTLRGGIIGNDALTSPVSPASAHNDAQNFTLSTAMAVKATATVTVPAGYSKALVIAVAQVGARNSTSSMDTLSVGIAINGVTTPGWAANIDSPATSTLHPVVSGTAAGTALLTGLGASFTVQARASSGLAAWAADVYNTANIDAIALFLR